MVALYRQRAARLFKPDWSDDTFHLLWDHALIWLFMANWLGKLAAMTLENYQRIEPQFRAVWLEPVLEAAQRQLS